jgi:hypothetical protein
VSDRDFDKTRRKRGSGPGREAKPEERTKIEPEIAHSFLSITLGERLRKRAPMTNIKDQQDEEEKS